MEKFVHLNSLKSTLIENRLKAKKHIHFFMLLMLLITTAIFFTAVYTFHLGLLTVATLQLTLIGYYFLKLSRLWKLNLKIEEKIKQIK